MRFRLTLQQDYTAGADDQFLVIPENKTVTWDLNGHTVDATALAGQILGISEGANLTLTDSSESHSGKIIGVGNGEETSKAVDIYHATFRMNGGTIEGSNFYSVIKDNGKFFMSGGNITGSSNGEIIRLNVNTYGYEKCELHISGGKIFCGEPEEAAIFINYESGSSDEPLLGISGSPEINGIVSFNSGGGVIKVSGTLSNTHPISVTTKIKPSASKPVIITSGLSGYGTIDNFACAMSGAELAINETSGELEIRRSSTGPSAFEELQGLLDNGGTVKLEKDYTALGADTTLQIHKNITLDLNGHTVDAAAIKEDIFSLYADLTITDSSEEKNGTIRHKQSRLVKINKDGTTFTLKNGNIFNEMGELYGEKRSSGRIIIEGGKVELTDAIRVVSITGYGSRFQMTGGTVTGSMHGEIVPFHIDGSSAPTPPIINISGGTIDITGKESILFSRYADFSMSGGTIKGSGTKNVLEFIGGTATITGGTISANEGNAIYHDADSFRLSGSPQITGPVYIPDSDHIIDVPAALTATSPVLVDMLVLPTVAAPVVFTGVLPSYGTAAKFRTDNQDYRISVDSQGRAVLGIPLTLSLTEPGTFGTIGVSAVNGSQVTGTPDFVLCGDQVSVTFTPAPGYVPENLIYTPEGGTAQSVPVQKNNNVYTAGFTMPDKNVTVSSTWKKLLTHTDISVEIPSQTYTGSILTPVITVKDGTDKTLSEGTDYTVTLPSGRVNAGNYTVTVTAKEDSTDYAGSTTKTFTIDPKEITIKADNKTKVYDKDTSTDPALTATVTGAVAGDTLNYTLSRAEGQAVGSYEITVTPGSNANYTVSTEKGTFSVTKRAVSVKADNKTKVYDKDANTDPELTATVTGAVDGETINYSLDREAGQVVRDYVITVTPGTNPNYTVTPANGKFSITQRPITVKAKNQSVNLNGSILTGVDQVAISSGTLLNGHNISSITLVSGSTANATTNGVITPSGAAVKDESETDVTANYKLSYANGILTVNKADIPAEDIKAPTEKTLTFDGSAQELVDKGTVSGNIGTMWYAVTDSTVTVAPEFDGESASADKKWSKSIPTAKDAGTYKVWYKVEGDKNHNPMAASQTPITVTIGKADAATSAISIQKKYLYLKDNTDRFTLTGLPEDCGTVTWNAPSTSGELTFTTAPAVSGSGVLSYTLASETVNSSGTIQIVAETQNYNDVTFTVSLKLVDQTPVKLKDGSSVSLIKNTLKYGQKLSDLQFDTAEFVSDDTDKDIVEGTLTWKEPDTIPNAGTIPAAWIFNPAGEVYIPCEGTVTVNIEKAAINPSVSITGWTYGDPSNSPSVTGNTGNGTVSYTYSVKGADSFSPAVPTNAGTFTVKATVAESTNYLGGTATADFTIAKADSSVKKEAAAVSGLEYDGKAHALVTAGEGNGGTMYYVLGSDDSNVPTDGFSDALPEGMDVGTYYVWSKIKGDDNHKDTAAAFTCSVSIAKNSHHPTVSLDAVIGVDDTREIDLSEYIEEDGTLGSPVKTDGNDIFEGSPAVNGNVLKFTTVNDEGIIGKTAALSVPVNNSKNYESYNIDITVKVDDKFKQDLSFAESEVTLKVDETFTNELSGAKTTVGYNCSDEKVATVDGTGKVTAVGAGTAVITATAAETDEYFPASASYTVTVIEEKEEKEEDNEETALPEKKPDKVPFTETGENYASKEDNFAPVTGGSGGDIKNLLLDFSKVSESSVDPSGLKMTVINGSKLVTKGKLKDADSAKASGGVKVKVDKKTLIPKITCKKSGSVTLTMEDDSTYTISFTVEKPKAQKAAKNMSKGGAPATKTVADLFGTHINAGELSIVKQKQSQATVSDNSLIVDPAEKDSIKLQYKYLNKNYKMTIKVK